VKYPLRHSDSPLLSKKIKKYAPDTHLMKFNSAFKKYNALRLFCAEVDMKITAQNGTGIFYL
jgi:hypothetical protein